MYICYNINTICITYHKLLLSYYNTFVVINIIIAIIFGNVSFLKFAPRYKSVSRRTAPNDRKVIADPGLISFGRTHVDTRSEQ